MVWAGVFSGGVVGGSTKFLSNVTINGNLTVFGTTTLNSATSTSSSVTITCDNASAFVVRKDASPANERFNINTTTGNIRIGSPTQTSGNQSLYIYGYDTAEGEAKYGAMVVDAAGQFNIISAPSQNVVIESRNILSLSPSAYGNVWCFSSTPVGNNREIRIYGYITEGSTVRYGYMKVDDSNDSFTIGVENNANLKQLMFYCANNDQQIFFNAGIKKRRTTVTSNYTLLLCDCYVAVTSTSSPITITLPTAATAGVGKTYYIKDESGGAGTNNITIARSGSDTIEGSTTYVINTNYGKVILYSNGSSGWFVR